MPSLQSAYLQKRYTLLAVAVILISAGMLAMVFFTGPSRATITIYTSPTDVTGDLDVTLNGGTDGASLTGSVTTTTANATVDAQPSGIGAEVDAHATGTMVIVNHSSGNQALAATTRLQSANGVIVRTTKRIDVGAGQEVSVPVTADPMGISGNLEAGRFTIVALWPGLQQKIYGDLRTAMTGGTTHQGSALDVDSLTKASDAARQKITDAHAATNTTAVLLTPASVVSTPPASTPSASYAVTVTMNVMTVTYSPTDLQTLVTSALMKNVPEGFGLTSVATPTWTLSDSSDPLHPVFRLHLSGKTSIIASAPTISTTKVSGQSVADAITTLRSAKGVSSVTITLNHSWQHSLPKDPARITINLSPAP